MNLKCNICDCLLFNKSEHDEKYHFVYECCNYECGEKLFQIKTSTCILGWGQNIASFVFHKKYNSKTYRVSYNKALRYCKITNIHDILEIIELEYDTILIMN